MKYSINKIARIGGILYLIIIATGLFGEAFVRAKLVVWSDPTATANNITSHNVLWRIGIAGDLIQHICDVPLMLIFYILLKPVNKYFALLALLFNLIQSAVLVATKLNLFTPLFLLGKADYLTSINAQHLHALSLVSIRADAYGFGLGLIFFGLVCIITGYLIFKSEYFPKLLGVLMQIAGVCYLINSFSLILTPKFTSMISPAILIPSFFGELWLCLWLIIKGVNVPKWEEKARRLRVGVESAFI